MTGGRDPRDIGRDHYKQRLDPRVDAPSRARRDDPHPPERSPPWTLHRQPSEYDQIDFCHSQYLYWGSSEFKDHPGPYAASLQNGTKSPFAFSNICTGGRRN